MVTTNYLWNDITDTVVMEKDGAGNTTAVYASDPVPFGRLRSMRRGGTTYNYHYDGRGNTTYLTDQTGRKTDAYTYDAFGTQRTATGSTENPYRFGGQYGYQYNPATDDYYVRARVYQPKRGRWRSKDPGQAVDWMNGYMFVGNGPLQLVDPSGLQPFDAAADIWQQATEAISSTAALGLAGGSAPAKKLGSCGQIDTVSVLMCSGKVAKKIGGKEGIVTVNAWVTGFLCDRPLYVLDRKRCCPSVPVFKDVSARANFLVKDDKRVIVRGKKVCGQTATDEFKQMLKLPKEKQRWLLRSIPAGSCNKGLYCLPTWSYSFERHGKVKCPVIYFAWSCPIRCNKDGICEPGSFKAGINGPPGTAVKGGRGLSAWEMIVYADFVFKEKCCRTTCENLKPTLSIGWYSRKR